MAKRSIRERWKLVPGYPNYEVSDQGRVRSLDRWVRLRHRNGTMMWRFQRGRMLSLLTDSKGYRYVHLGMPQKNERVHRLVLLAFRGPSPRGLEGCHNNGRRRDNRLGNLRYDTRRNNSNDRVAHGTANRGERNGLSKLTARNVKAIRKSQLNQQLLAERYHVSDSCIGLVLARKSWAWLP